MGEWKAARLERWEPGIWRNIGGSCHGVRRGV